MQDPSKTWFKLWSLYEWIGCALLALMAFAVPLTIVPPTIFPNFHTDRSWVVEGKFIVLQSLAGAALIWGALGIVGPSMRRYRGAVLLPVLFLLGYLGWCGLSVSLTPEPRYSLTFWMPHAFTVAAALTGPIFLRDRKKGLVVLLAIVAGGIIACSIGVVGGFGLRTMNRFFYGYDPRDAIEDVKQTLRGIQGGSARSGSISTLNNPEWAGGFAASIAVIFAVFIFDWADALRRKTLARFFFLGCLGILLLHLALTGTRQPWIALALAGALRLTIELKVSRLLLAVGFCVLLLVTFLGGLKAGLALAAVYTVVLAVISMRNGELRRLASRIKKPVALMLVIAPLILATGVVAFSTPGPWNPTGLRIAQRFMSATSGTEDSFSERSLMFSVASQMIRRKPLTGVGPGYYLSQFYPTLAELVNEDESGAMYLMRQKLGGRIAEQSHNDYLQIAAEDGIPSLLFFLAALLAILRGLLRIIDSEPVGLRRRLALAFLACIVTYLGIMFTSFPLQMPERSVIFWGCIGGALGLIAGIGDEAPSSAAVSA